MKTNIAIAIVLLIIVLVNFLWLTPSLVSQGKDTAFLSKCITYAAATLLIIDVALIRFKLKNHKPKH
jgi:membrane-anchored protein YejM (alkaline phosphatase superfamily)